MKTVMSMFSVVLLLSTATWVVMYYEFPDAPLKARETALIVFLWALLAASFQALWKRRQKRHGKEISEPQK
jgi:hypothetical protein